MLVSHARRNAQQVTKQGLVFLRRIIEGFHMFAGNDEHVRRRLRIDVANDDATIVLINYVGRSGARQNLTKEAIGLIHGPDNTTDLIVNSVGFTKF